MNTMKKLVVTSLALLPLLHAGPAQAENACRADARRYCRGVQPGDGRILECLRSHEGELSGACREKVASATGSTELLRACRSDASQLCKGVKPGGGAVQACLRSHADELSPGCKTEVGKYDPNPSGE